MVSIAKRVILIVDDHDKARETVKLLMESLQYSCLEAQNGSQAITLARSKKPDLIILDIGMPDIDGHTVCQQLRTDDDPKISRIPILILTAMQDESRTVALEAGADAFITIPFENADLAAEVKSILRRSEPPPMPDPAEECYISLVCKPDAHTNFTVEGRIRIDGTSSMALSLDVDALSREADMVMPHPDWRFRTKQVGSKLYQDVFVNSVRDAYHDALSSVEEATENLHLRFRVNRDMLRVPLEFMFSERGDLDPYLVLRHPVVRSLRGVQTRRRALSPRLFNERWSHGRSLRVLLIASDTEPTLARVDEEIEHLYETLPKLFGERHITLRVEKLLTEDATYQRVRDTLEKCDYEIVHYAGHGFFDKAAPETSYLPFWEQPNRQGSVKKLKASVLRGLLQRSNVRFFYLSCCRGAQAGTQLQLLDNDFLGLAEAIVQGGVPAVLGFRRPVSESGAFELAKAYYNSLAVHGQLDKALLEARIVVNEANRDDLTWVAPMLISQD